MYKPSLNGDKGYSIDIFNAFIKFKILGALFSGNYFYANRTTSILW